MEFIKLGPIENWRQFDDGAIVLKGGRRTVVVQVLAIGDGVLAIDDKGVLKTKTLYVPLRLGHNQVTVDVAGEVSLSWSGDEGGDAYWFTTDGTCQYVDTASLPSFTKLAQRRARNHELERIMFQMEQKFEERARKQMQEIERRLQADPSRDPITNRVIETHEEEIVQEDGDDDEHSASGEGQDDESAPEAGDKGRRK